MTPIAICAISGNALNPHHVAKKFEEGRSKQLFVFTWITKIDGLIRDWHHHSLHTYSEGKEKISFFVTKQVKLHSKNTFNKLVTFLKEKREHYENNMRNSRLLKKSDGISEFFKSMSEVEKGNGSIDESLEDSSQDKQKGVE